MFFWLVSKSKVGMMKAYDLQTPISYLTIVTTFLNHYDDISDPDDIFDFIYPDCLRDISETPLAKQLELMTPLPPGFIEVMYRFLEPEGRPGEIEVVFQNDMLVNFRSQLFFRGWFANRKALNYMARILKPEITGVLGDDNFQYDGIISTYVNATAIPNYIVAYRKVPKYASVSCWISHKGYQK